MKKVVWLNLFFIFVFSLYVKGYAEEEKSISFEEKYKDEDCIFLLLDIKIELNEDWSYVATYHKKLKIQKNPKSFGEIPIYYNDDREKITSIKAYTITPDGKKHRYSRVHNLTVYNDYTMYSDYMVNVLNMPEITVNAIIDYEFTRVTKKGVMENQFYHDRYFIYDYPIKELNFEIIFPKSSNMQYKEFDLEYKPQITETEDKIAYSWHMKNVAPDDSEYEDYMLPPTPEDINNLVEFSSIKNWDYISDWIKGFVDENMIINKRIKLATQKVIEGCKTKKDKIRAILEYIQDNFRYIFMSKINLNTYKIILDIFLCL